MKKNIFIAGHTGLLGNAVLKEFEKHYKEKIIIASHKELDLKNFEDLKYFIKHNSVSEIILCAGKTGGILKNKKFPADLFYENISITNNVFRLIVECNIEKIINFSSSCIYPKNSPQPIKEEYLCEGKLEETSLGYAAAKLAGVLATISYNQQYGKRILTLIPNTIYGENAHFEEDSHVLSAMIKKFVDAKRYNSDVILWGDGEVYREFIYCGDVANATYFAYEKFSSIKEDYLNVGTGEEISIRNLAEIIKDIVKFKGKIIWDKTKPSGVKRKFLDSSKFRKYGWKSRINLIDGIKRTISWYLKNC